MVLSDTVCVELPLPARRDRHSDGRQAKVYSHLETIRLSANALWVKFLAHASCQEYQMPIDPQIGVKS